ncbi:MAG TPA: FAD-binding oxidoreductase [Thermoleophilaceae bacterium]|jgi:UDP-N-acetylenolpyruvoylglucosamine reductase
MPSTDQIAADLRARIEGGVVKAGDTDWDVARRAFNLVIDQRPAAVALPSSAADVAAVVRYAAANGLRVAPQLTGHNAGPLGSLADTILLKTTWMTGVQIDPAARRARVKAGEVWGGVVEAAARHELAALHGSSPTVGVVGYTLGGGLGWLGRKHGLNANSVTAVELVTGDGSIVRADSETEPELFWAIRGGGGNFGVVTEIEFDLYPVKELYAGVLFFPFERADEVLRTWHEWTQDVPDEVTSIGRLLQLPPLPDIPEPLRGRSFSVVEAAYLGDEAAGAELTAPLRELGPEMDTFATIPAPGLSHMHMDPPEPVPALTDHNMVGDLPAAGVDALIAAAGPGSGSPLLSVELRHLGGALARSAPDHGAADTLRGDYAMFGVGVPMTDELAAASAESFGRVREALAPYDAGSEYANFQEKPSDAARLFGDGVHRRLQAVRAEHDPDGVLRANHPVEAAAA